MPKYRIDRTSPTKDGSGMIKWDVWALDDNDLVIPSRHANVLTPYDETQTALNDVNPSQALRALLIKYRPDGWDSAELSRIAANNLNSQTVDQAVTDFVQNQAGGYPVTFNA